MKNRVRVIKQINGHKMFDDEKKRFFINYRSGVKEVIYLKRMGTCIMTEVLGMKIKLSCYPTIEEAQKEFYAMFNKKAQGK